ncbi:hypothetical protein TNCV_3630301 [Trichonephila clavipes]|nr:hypothetical protein TNCV_3630301 [Trichonephila clavipes]
MSQEKLEENVLKMSELGHFNKLVYRELVTTQTDLVVCQHAASTSMDNAHSPIPHHFQACFGMHGGDFCDLPPLGSTSLEVSA